MHKHWYQNRGWALGRLILAVGACACAWQSPVIYGSPWGVALWPTAVLHIINIPGKAVWQDGEEAELWKMKPRRLHLARGVMPRETLMEVTPGFIGTSPQRDQWDQLTHMRTHTDPEPPTRQPCSFSQLLNHHKWVDANTLFIFPNQYLLALKWNKRTYVRFLFFSPSAFYTRLPWL